MMDFQGVKSLAEHDLVLRLEVLKVYRSRDTYVYVMYYVHVYVMFRPSLHTEYYRLRDTSKVINWEFV